MLEVEDYTQDMKENANNSEIGQISISTAAMIFLAASLCSAVTVQLSDEPNERCLQHKR